MTNKIFSKIRKRMGKTQKQMAQLLGVSLKAVQSFEQGWRNIPAYVERHLYFLMFRLEASGKKIDPCWTTIKCPLNVKRRCPAWEYQTGDLCWFINGTICHGEPEKDWHEKMISCRKCKVFKEMIPDL